LKERPVAVVVVGDLARSPRMLNHARELARARRSVCLVGLRERAFEPPAGVAVAPLRGWRRIGAFGVPGSAIRMGLTFLELLETLLRQKPAAILVQNPPTFPTLLAAWIAGRWLRAPLLVDWHNYGYSMLALRLGAGHPIARLSARHEGWMAHRADHHFCVSRAMQTDLSSRFAVQARVLYDRPVSLLAADRERSTGPLIIVCPAGWTAEEDMALLLDALELLGVSESEFHLTGDGPLRESLEARMDVLRTAGWKIYTGFRKEAEYRALLQVCDIGISMHRSSSGLDLAMKVVDLFAAGAPVCAFDYGDCVREQIADGETGFLFRTADELAALLARCQREPAILATMRQRVRERWSSTWSEEWRRGAEPLFEKSA
jgi:beta-1,4-mannosyltransferase